LFAKKINKGKVRTSKAEMKQFASNSEEGITAKRQNIVHINTIISNKAAANLLRSYLKEKDMETNFEMFDVARQAEHSPIFVWMHVQKVELFTKPQH
jgi:hypothetical protein